MHAVSVGLGFNLSCYLHDCHSNEHNNKISANDNKFETRDWEREKKKEIQHAGCTFTSKQKAETGIELWVVLVVGAPFTLYTIVICNVRMGEP